MLMYMTGSFREEKQDVNSEARAFLNLFNHRVAQSPQHTTEHITESNICFYALYNLDQRKWHLYFPNFPSSILCLLNYSWMK